jgi:hypothetical protein
MRTSRTEFLGLAVTMLPTLFGIAPILGCRQVRGLSGSRELAASPDSHYWMVTDCSVGSRGNRLLRLYSGSHMLDVADRIRGLLSRDATRFRHGFLPTYVTC